MPRRLTWDHEPGSGCGKRRADRVGGFPGTLVTTLVRLRPVDPGPKGIGNQFFETPPCSAATFSSPADFNSQFAEWLSRANARVERTIKARLVDLARFDKAAMLPLPPVVPLVGRHNRFRLGRDCCGRVEASDHSVDPL